MRPRKVVLCCLLFVAACSWLSGSQAPRTTRHVALFEGARLIVGDGQAPIENSAFIVEKDRFTRIGRKDELRPPDGAVRVDLTGKTVIPALIDAHAHIGYMRDLSSGPQNYTRENILDHLRRFAYFGVAAGMSMGSDWGDLPFQMRDESHPGAARFLTAGRGLAPEDEVRPDNMRHSAYRITTEEEARKAVRELAARKVTIVKTWVDDRGATIRKLGPPLYRAIIDEAHKHNVRVVAHATALADAKDLVRSGLDGFAHMVQDVDDEFIALLEQRPNIFFLLALGGPRRTIHAPWVDPPHPLVRETVSSEQIKRLKDRLASAKPDALERSRQAWDAVARGLAKLNRAGVRIGLGTDGGGQTGDQFVGWTVHTELENMVAAGMTPAQAIVAATRTSAAILGLDELGMVAAGKSADFVVLDANPLDDITNTRRIARVYLRGQEVDRVRLRARWTTGEVPGQSGTRNGEWPTYGGDPGHTRYAPLDQITAENFSTLEVAWRFKTDSLGPRPEFQFESTPLMVNGVLYSTAGTRRAVVALDAATGELLWMHSEHEGARGAAAPRQLSGRGLAYWTDSTEQRILYVTPGYRLVALDAKTGNPVASFGQKGIVDLKLEFDQEIDLVTGQVGLHATPAVANDVVIVGAAHATGANPKSKRNVKGYVRGYDVRTGKRLWIFHTIPLPGEFGHETWENESWVYSGNTGVWAQISVDEQLGMAYLPVELPTGDYYGGDRPGNNLFAESLVAVDLKTGQRRWHFQLVHHGIWDMDIPAAPILADITVNGRAIKAVAQPTKQGFLYVFNRETGEPVWPIEERLVPKGDTPGEWYSPTQPFPTKPPAYDRQGLSIDDLIDFTPELRAEAVKLVSRYRLGPLFTPPSVSKAEGPIATLTMAAQGAATNWPGGSYDPEIHILYVFSQSAVATLGLVPPDPSVSDFKYHQGTVLTGARRAGGSGSADRVAQPAAASGEGGGGAALTVQGLPLIKPPYGRISAIDLDTGDIRWQVPHGETPDSVRNHPALKGLNIPRTGRPGMVGTLVTKTLLIAGEPGFSITPSGLRGSMLRAYDKATGKEVGAVYMPAPQSGSPMTYMLNGTQYLVVAISGGIYSGELLAFRVPE